MGRIPYKIEFQIPKSHRFHEIYFCTLNFNNRMKIAMFCCEILITGMKISIRLIKSIGNIMKKNKELLRICLLRKT